MLFDCLFAAHFHVSLKGGLGAGLPGGHPSLVVNIWGTMEVLSLLHEPLSPPPWLPESVHWLLQVFSLSLD